MPIILSIETSTKTCSIAIHKDKELLSEYSLHIQNSHSSVISKMIQNTLSNLSLTLKDVNAIAVSEGPGSYTGLRIGLSTAKGLAYALEIPIIKISTLKAMAYSQRQYAKDQVLFPMIDARRMEVYTMQVSSDGKIIKEPYPLILDENTFSISSQKVLIFGNGSEKCKKLYSDNSKVTIIDDIAPSAKYIGILALEKFENQQFENLQELEPFYLKEFYTPKPKNPLKK